MSPYTKPSGSAGGSWDVGAASGRVRALGRRLLMALVSGGHGKGGNQAGLPADAKALEELRDRALRLSPVTKRHAFTGLSGVPEGMTMGWAQLESTVGRGFSIGVFIGRGRFAPIAFADDRGRVFAGMDVRMDVHGVEPEFMFTRENDGLARDGSGFGGRDDDGRNGIDAAGVPVVQGGMVGRDSAGVMIWLASWMKRHGRYELGQLRMPLPPARRRDLGYRDALTLGFLAAYLLPRFAGLLLGFGSGNVFRRLNREAPIGAIRRSVADARRARAHGLRVSGLEEHFIDLMDEAGVLGPLPGLEPVHGAEPLHLYTSSYSGGFVFGWGDSLAFPAILRSLRIEGNLNRFAAVSACLERGMRLGSSLTEDTVTRRQAARMDLALLADPAIIALSHEDSVSVDPLNDNGIDPVMRLVDVARATAERLAGEDASASGRARSSEWTYRQTLALLVRSLRLPYRFDTEFRSDLASGSVAMAFTTAGLSMMPAHRYDAATGRWLDVDEAERAAMSADYNLRVGIMMAAIGFGADPRVSSVSLHVDSIGLEEAVAEQDGAIARLMSQALNAFESMRTADSGMRGSKADPKDGDVHGNSGLTSRVQPFGDGRGQAPAVGPAKDSPESGPEGPTLAGSVGTGPMDTAPQPASTSADSPAASSRSTSSVSSEAGSSDPSGQDGADDGALDNRFEDLMRNGDIDEVAFSMPGDNRADADDGASGSDAASGGSPDAKAHGSGDDDSPDADDGTDSPEDPLAALHRNPTVRSLVTVTFTRDRFLTLLRRHGLNDPRLVYRCFDAAMDVDGQAGLRPIDAGFDLRDSRFSPPGSQEEPELSDAPLPRRARRILGTSDVTGLSIQREDLLQRAVTDFHHLAADGATDSVVRAQRSMAIVDALGDPELRGIASDVGAAIIDGRDTPDPDFALSRQLDAQRVKARDLLFSGRTDQAFDLLGKAAAEVDARFASGSGVPRYFNSYAERVVYNRLFATPGERTVLIPDNLFYTHLELADALAQIRGVDAALPHLNAMVSYAPAYALSHMKLAIQLARSEDWDSARAACLNALRVALDRDDAAFAYYRFAYASWMRDEFDVAMASYVLSAHIAPGHIAALDGEMSELSARARSQCIPVPQDVDAAKRVLQDHGLPVWPHTEVGSIVREAARVCVDEGLFVPARTLALAAARMNDTDVDGVDLVQVQFLRSLNA
ncbi:tetratricopeptide repeat protein [uncultured Bifidobacterium sp.]|uniref:tetratricopeptide repeat protein n=1 Tax=uncultured Bifidobacterium sp. TaxID=165187 RepID=UPI0028DCD4D2|nr:tetratricopeptide repeat protein [uncultured Bifidobacterium sp.]